MKSEVIKEVGGLKMTCTNCCIHSGVTKYEEESCPFYKTELETDRQNAAFMKKQQMLEDCLKRGR